ncbi:MULTISPECIES: hypothetical protein [unclassified Leifsonia]|uniref:hypothetical protein n=1 Tax=unclassified Leifsonia TaxID=2663824 RepID=UPI000B7CAA6E|nr:MULTISPECIES: hypothetical protein [unclassified Leifsonia]
MADITPAHLSLELNVSQKQIRDALRGRYGILQDGTTRWKLTDDQAAAVRARFVRRTFVTPPTWTLEPGDTVLRRELHAAYGGSARNGIVTLRSLPDIIAFTDPASGAGFGYHLYEGLQPDGSYSYTGAGQRGDQRFTRGNLAIRDSSVTGRPIRLFTVNGTSVTYVGEFTTGTPTFWPRTIPDRDNIPRNGIVFNLVPVHADSRLLAPASEPTGLAQLATWSPPDATDVVIAGDGSDIPGDRTVSRIEFELQAAFGVWLLNQGEMIKRLLLASGDALIEPDLFVESRGWIVEAKKSSGREYVRTAIGQVLDYVYVAEKAKIAATPVILLPGRPSEDLVELLHRLGITLIVRTGNDFNVIASPTTA